MLHLQTAAATKTLATINNSYGYRATLCNIYRFSADDFTSAIESDPNFCDFGENLLDFGDFLTAQVLQSLEIDRANDLPNAEVFEDNGVVIIQAFCRVPVVISDHEITDTIDYLAEWSDFDKGQISAIINQLNSIKEGV